MVDTWMDQYEKAWRGTEGTDLTTVFSDDIAYKTSPYKPAMEGLEAVEKFWKEATDDGEEFTMSHEIVAIEGDIAVVKVTVDHTKPDEEHWMDMWIIQLDDDGLCFYFEEWPLKQS